MDKRVLAEPVLVGREIELEHLNSHLNSVLDGKGATIFISGEAGSGKTRLVTEFLNGAKTKGFRAITGWCMSKAAVPYFPFTEAFSAYLSSERDEEPKVIVAEQLGIIGWLKGAGSPASEQLGIAGWLRGPKHKSQPKVSEGMSPEILKDITFAAVTKALLSISAHEPVILFIEDIHWADSASLSLLHYISRAILSSRVLVLATFRREELPPDSEGHPHPLVETLRLMSREDLYDEVKLSDLREDDVLRLAESMVGGKVQYALIEVLTKESQGNPLFAVESLRMLFQSGGLIEQDGQWRMSVGQMQIPNKVKDVILRRLGILNSSQRKILELASTIGEEFDPTLIGAVLSLDKLHVLENLSTVAQNALLINPEDSVYRFSHARFRDVLYEEIAQPLRREYHARIAETIESISKSAGEAPVNDLAFHYAQAGNKEKAVKYALVAGEDALKRYSNAEAVKHFKYVLDAISDDPKRSSEIATATEGLGDAYLAMSSFEEAIKTFEHLAGLSDSGATRLRALRKAMEASFHRGEMTHALELAGKAAKDASSDELESARIRMIQARTNVFRGNPKQALGELESCLKVFEEKNASSDVADALLELGTFYVTGAPRMDDAREVLSRVVELYEDLRNSRKLIEAYFFLANAYLFTGLHQEALDCFAKLVDVGARIGEYNRMSWAGLYSGLMYESMGELDKMLSYSQKALEYAKKTDSFYLQSMVYANLTRAYAKIGNSENTETCFHEFKRLFGDTSRTASKLALAVGVRTEAVVLAVKGQWDEANKHFDQCLELYKDAPAALLHESWARADYAYYLSKQGRSADACRQIEAAIDLCKRINNGTQIAKLNAMLEQINQPR